MAIFVSENKEYFSIGYFLLLSYLCSRSRSMTILNQEIFLHHVGNNTWLILKKNRFTKKFDYSSIFREDIAIEIFRASHVLNMLFFYGNIEMRSSIAFFSLKKSYHWTQFLMYKTHHRFKKGFGVDFVPHHYLNQCWQKLTQICVSTVAQWL